MSLTQEEQKQDNLMNECREFLFENNLYFHVGYSINDKALHITTYKEKLNADLINVLRQKYKNNVISLITELDYNDSDDCGAIISILISEKEVPLYFVSRSNDE